MDFASNSGKKILQSESFHHSGFFIEKNLMLLLSQITQRGNIFSSRKTSAVGKLMCVCPCLKGKYMCAGLMHHSCSNMIFSLCSD